MRGDVFQADVGERVGVGQVGAVAHQGAAVTLRVVVLGGRKAVVDEEGGTPGQSLGEGRDEGFGLGVDLGHAAGSERAVERRPQQGQSVVPREAGARGHHTSLEPAPAVEVQQLHRHRVEHFVADDDTFDRLGQRVDPCDLVAEHGKALTLAFAQLAREVDDGVALDEVAERVECAERAEQLRRQRARAGAELDHRARAACLQRLRDLARQRAAEERRQLGRGDEVAARAWHLAEFDTRVGVVAEPRGIERHRHEAVERQPAGVAFDRRVEQSREWRRPRRYTGVLVI